MTNLKEIIKEELVHVDESIKELIVGNSDDYARKSGLDELSVLKLRQEQIKQLKNISPLRMMFEPFYFFINLNKLSYEGISLSSKIYGYAAATFQETIRFGVATLLLYDFIHHLNK